VRTTYGTVASPGVSPIFLKNKSSILEEHCGVNSLVVSKAIFIVGFLAFVASTGIGHRGLSFREKVDYLD
jgi:hypothetical protein